MVLDPTLHLLASFPIAEGDADTERVFEFLNTLPPPQNFAGFEIPAPVLVLPNVLDQPLCARLIDLYEAKGGIESGFMRDGKVVADASFKRRKDYVVTDRELLRILQSRIATRVNPEIKKLFFMDVTHTERYIVGCYSAEDGGHFSPHRDNSGVSAYRRFALSINLNNNFEGGGVIFPEYNRRQHKAPAGWAVVFPCAILHQVAKVTAGRRYAFLPFVYDEAGAAIKKKILETPEGKALPRSLQQAAVKVRDPAA
jgi:predicted 2-oxoglutarate/Fe(II)-dependent dioxygenase YbiX